MASKESEPYWPPIRYDKKPYGKQPLGYKGFCVLCGTYSRHNLTRADYRDPVTRSHASGLVCTDCYSLVTETEEGEAPDLEG